LLGTVENRKGNPVTKGQRDGSRRIYGCAHYRLMEYLMDSKHLSNRVVHLLVKQFPRRITQLPVAFYIDARWYIVCPPEMELYLKETDSDLVNFCAYVPV
jgi:hypothetical protein